MPEVEGHEEGQRGSEEAICASAPNIRKATISITTFKL